VPAFRGSLTGTRRLFPTATTRLRGGADWAGNTATSAPIRPTVPQRSPRLPTQDTSLARCINNSTSTLLTTYTGDFKVANAILMRSTRRPSRPESIVQDAKLSFFSCKRYDRHETYKIAATNAREILSSRVPTGYTAAGDRLDRYGWLLHSVVAQADISSLRHAAVNKTQASGRGPLRHGQDAADPASNFGLLSTPILRAERPVSLLASTEHSNPSLRRISASRTATSQGDITAPPVSTRPPAASPSRGRRVCDRNAVTTSVVGVQFS